MFSFGRTAPITICLRRASRNIYLFFVLLEFKIFSICYFKYTTNYHQLYLACYTIDYWKIPFLLDCTLREPLAFLFISSPFCSHILAITILSLTTMRSVFLTSTYVKTYCILLFVSVLSHLMHFLQVLSQLLQMAGFNSFVMTE